MNRTSGEAKVLGRKNVEQFVVLLARGSGGCAQKKGGVKGIHQSSVKRRGGPLREHGKGITTCSPAVDPAKKRVELRQRP